MIHNQLCKPKYKYLKGSGANSYLAFEVTRILQRRDMPFMLFAFAPEVGSKAEPICMMPVYRESDFKACARWQKRMTARGYQLYVRFQNAFMTLDDEMSDILSAYPELRSAELTPCQDWTLAA